MTVQELVSGIRFKQKDNNEVKFSDYDIIQSLNEALRYINQSYAMRNSDFLEKIVPYHQKEMNEEIEAWNKEHPDEQKEKVDFRKGVDLPDDFLMLVSLRGAFGHPLSPCPADVRPHHHHYKIVGRKLFLSEDADMLYRYTLPQVSKMEDEVDLPFIFYDPIVKVTGMILNQSPDTDVMMDAINTMVENLVPARRYAHFDMPLPFYVRS